jgi:hypothetical protein
MVKRLYWAGFGLALAALAVGAALSARAQEAVADAPQPTRPVKIPALPDRLAEKPSQPPASKIALEPLGFSAPSSIYLGQRFSFVSLDFLDEDHLLFTFRVPGLIHRLAGDRDAGKGEERQIRAVVLELPSGAVKAEALWTVHDRQRYLWMLAGGRFLLRDRENLELGDASLELKPFLRFPGPLLRLEMDPEQKFLVTNSREAAAAVHQPEDVPSPPTAEAEITVDGKQQSSSEIAVRILRRDSGEVMLVSHARAAMHLPINSEGYMEVLRAPGGRWLLRLNYFSGGSRILGQVESVCAPAYDFLSRGELLLTTCTLAGPGMLTAITTDSRRLWEALTSEATVWPLMVKAPDGLRMAREALAVTHPVTTSAPLLQDEIKGQLVEILDAANGKVVLETSASPILDGGGNVAISPSGRRVAVLSAGAIQLFELPPPQPLPEAAPIPVPLSAH